MTITIKNAKTPEELVHKIVLIDGQTVRRIIKATKTEIKIFPDPAIKKLEAWDRKTGQPVNHKGKKRSIELITMAQAVKYLVP